MNSREKGKRGERQWRDELRGNGYAARRGQQFSGSADSPDVVCGSLPKIHFEVKAVERLNIEDAMDQARRDAGSKVPIVAHRRNFRPWLVTMNAETFFRLLRGDFAGGKAEGGNTERLKCEPTAESVASAEGVGADGQSQMADGKAGEPAHWPQRRD
jgi:hypothetical protein